MKRFSLLLILVSIVAISAFSQTVYDGKGGGATDLAVSLIVDSDSFSGSSISVTNYVFQRLSFNKSTGYYKGNPWFDDSLTVRLDDASSALRENKIQVYFHPRKDDVEGLKFFISMKGKYLSVPYKVSFKAKAYKYSFPNNPIEYIILLVEELTLNGVTYRGEIPTSLLQ
jgi:hypothetical protein